MTVMIRTRLAPTERDADGREGRGGEHSGDEAETDREARRGRGSTAPAIAALPRDREVLVTRSGRLSTASTMQHDDRARRTRSQPSASNRFMPTSVVNASWTRTVADAPTSAAVPAARLARIVPPSATRSSTSFAASGSAAPTSERAATEHRGRDRARSPERTPGPRWRRTRRGTRAPRSAWSPRPRTEHRRRARPGQAVFVVEDVRRSQHARPRASGPRPSECSQKSRA